MSRAPQELERTTAQGQMEAINAGMVKYVIRAYGETISDQCFLPDSAKELVRQMMVIAAKVNHHFQREGSLDGLKVLIGYCPRFDNQEFYVRNSFISELADPKDMEALDVRSRSRCPSKVEGLEIIKEDVGVEYFEYFLAAKEPKWVEED